MIRFDSSPPEIALPPHIIDTKYNEYPITNEPPRIERMGTTELFVTPMTEQAELIGEANTLQGNNMDDSLHKLERKLKQKPPAEGEGAQTKILDNDQRLVIEAEILELQTNINVFTRINARLRGGVPNKESRKGIQTQAVLGAVSIHQEVAQKAKLPLGEVRFTGLEVLAILKNLEVSAADLRRQANHQKKLADSATLEMTAITHSDQAQVLGERADRMLTLHANLLMQRSK